MTRPPAPLAALVLFALALTGCASAPAGLPDGVTASVYQNRFDYSLRQMQIKVSNGTDETITVTRATLDSTRWTEPAVWDRPQEIPPGAARDLKVLLGAADCDAVELEDVVTLGLTLADGGTVTGTLVPEDETGRLAAVYAQDCLGEEIAAVATITPPDAVTWVPGAGGAATVDLTITPTGAEGEFTIHQAKGTVLLKLVDEGGATLEVQPLERVVVASTGAGVIRLLVEPTRCDPHAVAEDKRGTFFPLDVSTPSGNSGTIYVAVSDEVRLSIYEFFADHCGLP